MSGEARLGKGATRVWAAAWARRLRDACMHTAHELR